MHSQTLSVQQKTKLI